jgi:hypothetical protein
MWELGKRWNALLDLIKLNIRGNNQVMKEARPAAIPFYRQRSLIAIQRQKVQVVLGSRSLILSSER